MKKHFLPLALGIMSLCAHTGSANETARVLFEENFERRPAGQRPDTFTWTGFPEAANEDKHNGIAGAESGASVKNKVLRMYIGLGTGGLALTEPRTFTRAIAEIPEAGSSQLLTLTFDYRNLGTASTWCRLGFREEGQDAGSAIGVAFNGSATPGKGGIFISTSEKGRLFLNGPSGPLQSLSKEVWYRIRLEINLKEQTARAFAEQRDSTEQYSSDTIPCANVIAGKHLSELFFDFVKAGGAIANYRFELDNIKVEVQTLD